VVKSIRDGEFIEVSFAKGVLQNKKKGKTKEENGTWVEFTPDPTIFKKYAFRKEYVLKRLWHYAYLNTGLTLFCNGEKIHSEHGLLDLLNSEVKDDRLYEPLHYRGKNLEFAFLHSS